MKKEGQSCKNCIVKRNGHTEKFDEKKVYGSVYAACASAHYEDMLSEKTAEKITNHIKKFTKGKKMVKSEDIHKKVVVELKKKDEHLAFFYEHHLPNLKKL
jgi:transcriptional regulator NrdR family protein